MALVSSFTGNVPANYDQYLGPVLFEPYALDLVARLQHLKPEKVLETACGTGRLTRHLLRILPQEAALTATDLNADMIETAKKLVPGPVHWQVADAQNLPFPDKTFDLAVCQYGVMFFPNKQVAFAETYRVLKPNGRFLFNTWDELKTNPGSETIRRVLEEELKEAAPDFFTKGPYSFYDEEEIRGLMKGAGFRNVTLQAVEKTSPCASADDFINGFIKGTPLDAYMANLDPSLRQALDQKVKQAMVAAFGERDLQIPLRALVCEGQR